MDAPIFRPAENGRRIFAMRGGLNVVVQRSADRVKNPNLVPPSMPTILYPRQAGVPADTFSDWL